MQATLAAERGGIVLNDHYTKDEYIKRRVHYLSLHPDYKQITNGLVPTARRDAKIIFQNGEQALSVQEVRRREVKDSIDPLLPLPTTENTDTIDSFRSYPVQEWTPRPRTPNRAKNKRASSLPASMPTNAVNELAETGIPSLAETAHSKLAQNTPTQLTHAANKATSAVEQSRARSISPIHQKQHDHTTSPTQPTDSSPANNMSTLLTSPFSSSPLGMKRLSSPPAANMSQAEVISRAMNRRISERLAASPNLYVSRNTSALAGRGMHVPVKQKRGTKRKVETPEPEPTDSVVDARSDTPSTTDEQRPKKKFKLLGPRSSSQASSGAGLLEPGIKDPKEKKKQESQKAANAKLAASQPSGRRGSATKNHLEAVVAGTALPKNKAEAEQAAKLRYDRLLAAHKASQETARRASNTPPRKYSKDARAPDFPPEFFSPANFRKGEEDETVRCVCGVRADDGGQMLCCDGEGCAVWQHVGCMGAAVPEDLEVGSYLCQVCDPFGHRVLLARLRREG